MKKPDVMWRIANALYEAMRYRKQYKKNDHLVVFDTVLHTYGISIFSERYDNRKKYDVIRLYELTENDTRTWIHDFNTDTLTFEEMCHMILKIARL